MSLKLFARIALVVLFCACCSGCSYSSNTSHIKLNSGFIAYNYHSGESVIAVFQSGLGDEKSVWSDVARQLPATQSYFMYDRYGYGDSNRTMGTRDACTIAREQHELLAKLGIPPPYLLVGHSIGGLYEYVYALMYPQEVAGLVLLDPTHPQHWQTMQVEAPNTAAVVKAFRYTAFSLAERDEFDAQANCINTHNVQLSPRISRNTQMFTSTEMNSGEQGTYQDMLKKLRNDWLNLLGIHAEQRTAEMFTTNRSILHWLLNFYWICLEHPIF